MQLCKVELKWRSNAKPPPFFFFIRVCRKEMYLNFFLIFLQIYKLGSGVLNSSNLFPRVFSCKIMLWQYFCNCICLILLIPNLRDLLPDKFNWNENNKNTDRISVVAIYSFGPGTDYKYSKLKLYQSLRQFELYNAGLFFKCHSV
jgi:hypothetical protein